MQRKPLFWFLICLVCLGGSAYFWHLGNEWQAQKAATRPTTNPAVTNAPAPQAAAVPHALAPAVQAKPASTKAPADPRYPYRLSNTSEPNGKLVRNNKAILLLNALIDTSKPIDLAIPDALRAKPNSGSYIVQARGPLDDQFRAALRNANAAIISYIPNNAYLVRVSDAGAQQLAGVAQSVLPFEPYYKLDPSLLALAINQPQALPPNGLNVTVFPDAYQQTLSDLKQLGALVVGQQTSPFGPLLQVQPASGTLLSDVASLPGVQAVAPLHTRKLANDLDRPRLGVSADSITPTNYLGLSGAGITININDSGIDATHPDLTGRISGFPLTDTSGHGTHVAGTILGNGTQSSTVTTNPPGSVIGANFRGMAPAANAFILDFESLSDAQLQETAAEEANGFTNLLISNNSWNYGDSASYDIEAASYDAAVRDALPQVPGSQPLVFVFSAGNDGGGFSDGSGGLSDSILSPATAKNVITVGAIEQPRFITNLVSIDGGTNNSSQIYNDTDSGDEVADFSARGNVGLNVEGTYGRFKPDLVAPGTYVISCRSGQWDTNAYYNPTNINFVTEPNQVVDSNSFTSFFFDVPAGAFQLIITLVTNSQSLSNSLPPLFIYGQDDNFPTIDPSDLLGTNQITLPSDGAPVVPGDTLYFDVQNNTLGTVNFDVEIEVLSTNDNGNFFDVLSNMNNQLGPYYRYESGTSMAAAGISGMLALMQQYLEQQLSPAITPSPALLKALLINGSRSVSDQYNFLTANSSTPTSEGWGLPSLPNILPAGPGGGSNTVQFYDQDPNLALATGQSLTRKLVVSPAGGSQDLRVTLVWTDPPGNPTAGVKLVNDLDLIVTNLDTGEVFYGNDFQANIPYSEAASAGNTNSIDSINNVENVFLQGPLDGTNYTITVLGARVNVNAVTANTNNVVQDYALVVSSGDAGGAANPYALTEFNNGLINTNNPVTNFMVLNNSVPLLNQRVGANSQFSATTNNGLVNTNGLAAQWNFYVFTNIPPTNASDPGDFTNVAFVTFLPPNLSVPRMGALQEVAPPDTNATRYAGADVDLYVSMDSTLTNLNPVAIDNAFKSVTRTGNETVFFTNSSPGAVYYVGVKSEDQEGAQFNLIGFATDVPFDQRNTNGTVTMNMNTVPLVIPGGAPTQPSSKFLIGICTQPMSVLKVVVSNTVTCQDFGDYIGALSEGTASAVLNNHSFFANVNDATETLVYDDSGQNNIPGAIASAGPGTLRSFTGINALGTAWTYTIVNDSSLTDTGEINRMNITLTPQPPVGTAFAETIPADSWFYGFVDVPDNATNLTISVSGDTAPVDLYIKEGSFPTAGSFDDFAIVGVGQTNFVSVNSFSSPPLNPGRYFYGIFNPNATAQNVEILAQLGLSLTPVSAMNFLSPGNETLLDDAVTYSTNHVGVNETVVSADVGVRIIHPRESDLVLTLISPQGTRVLLAENRGGLDTNGYGSGFSVTNVAPEMENGSQLAETNTYDTANNFGTLDITYNFFTIPDDMRIYYDGVRIFDSGLVSGAGTFSVSFGPGGSTNVQIVMNQAGTNPSTNETDLWQYQVTVISEDTSYAVFSENTNLATVPIKFAVPPFGSGTAFIPPLLVDSSSFEGVLATNYSLTNASSVVDGWTNNTSNAVTVVTVPFLADTGSNVLALHQGSITRTFATTPGQTYTVRFVNHGPPGSQGPVGWWKGEGNTVDKSGNGNNGIMIPGVTVDYASGEVGDAFLMNGTVNQHVHVPDAPDLRFTNSMTAEAWIFPTVVALDHAILVKYDSVGGGPFQSAFSFSLGGSGFGYLLLNANGRGGLGAVAQTPAALPLNQWSHLAGTYDGNNIKIYLNGLLVGTTAYNLGIFPGTDALGIGANLGGSPDSASTAPFAGEIDEATLYSNALTGAQIDDIYAAGYVGKAFPVGTYTPVTATVILGPMTNTIVGLDQWATNVYTFTAVTNTMSLTIIPNTNFDGSVQDGMLVDSFTVFRDAAANPTNYYLPEESLAKVAGENSFGDWKLEVMDNRVGPPNAVTTLVSWELSLVLASTVPAAASLSEAITQTNTVPPNSIVYYFVDVPPWALFATNNLSVTSGGPLNLLFNQTVEPTGTNGSDVKLISNLSGNGASTLSTTGTPQLLPGERYFLGVQNTSPTTPATFAIQVDFNITTLTNAIPDTNQLIAVGNIPRYFQFDVDTNEATVLFQIFNASGSLELVVSKGAPLPDQSTFNYLGAGSGSINITVTTNSTPVPLGPGRWFLGVFNNDSSNVNYSIVATEVGPPHIIPLTNGVPFMWNAGPGPDLTNFFVFTITNNAPSALFELYNLSGDVDLDLDLGVLPYAPPFLASSTNSGTSVEQIVMRTNFVGSPILVTNSLGGTNWYLGVPNNTTNIVTYTILAETPINGMLTNGLPFNLTATLPTGGSGNPVLTWQSVDGESYVIQISFDLVTWSNLSTNFGTGSLTSFSDPISFTTQPFQFFRIKQIPDP